MTEEQPPPAMVELPDGLLSNGSGSAEPAGLTAYRTRGPSPTRDKAGNVILPGETTPRPDEHGNGPAELPKTADAWSWGRSDTTPSDAVERLKQLCKALGEPYESPGSSRLEPPWVMDWERALSIVRGRTAVWRDLLARAQVTDSEWLSAYRGGDFE